MDTKLSQMPVATVVQATDLVPIVRGIQNLIMTIGVMALNLPNFGNKGITKNAPVVSSTASIPLTATLVTLSNLFPAYTLPSGSDGQSVTLVATAPVTVTPSLAKFITATMVDGSSLTLTYVGSRWVVTASHTTTFV